MTLKHRTRGSRLISCSKCFKTIKHVESVKIHGELCCYECQKKKANFIWDGGK
jgi:hypothetical protein